MAKPPPAKAAFKYYNLKTRAVPRLTPTGPRDTQILAQECPEVLTIIILSAPRELLSAVNCHQHCCLLRFERFI
eukprot:3726720-Amphidinium_carterae.1